MIVFLHWQTGCELNVPTKWVIWIGTLIYWSSQVHISLRKVPLLCPYTEHLEKSWNSAVVLIAQAFFLLSHPRSQILDVLKPLWENESPPATPRHPTHLSYPPREINRCLKQIRWDHMLCVRDKAFIRNGKWEISSSSLKQPTGSIRTVGKS